MNEEGSNLKTSPRQNSQSVTTLQKTSISSRSPFSIRRVKPVKPDKLPPTTTNNNNSHLERSTSNASKKRSYFRRKSSSQGNNSVAKITYISYITLQFSRVWFYFSFVDKCNGHTKKLLSSQTRSWFLLSCSFSIPSSVRSFKKFHREK